MGRWEVVFTGAAARPPGMYGALRREEGGGGGSCTSEHKGEVGEEGEARGDLVLAGGSGRDAPSRR